MLPQAKSPAKPRVESAVFARRSSVRKSSLRQPLPLTSTALPADKVDIAASRVAARGKQDLWIAPSTSLSRRAVDSDWSLHQVQGHARLLELADIALGLRKPEVFRRRRSLFLSSQSARQ